MRVPIEFIFLGGVPPKQEVVEVVLVNNTAKAIDVEVPDGKIWLLLSIKMVNPDNVTRVIYVSWYKESAKTNLIGTLCYASTTTGGSLTWPNTQEDALHIQCWFPCILKNGNVLSFNWAAGGVSAGGTDADGLVYTYLEIDIE